MVTADGLARVSVDGISLLMPERDAPVFARFEFERLTREVFIDRLPEGGVVVDVGAHVGILALHAARRVGPSGRVHAVEPTPRNADTLVANAELNGLENVRLHRCAAGREAGHADLHRMGLSYLNSVVAPNRYGVMEDSVRVPVSRLDDLVSGRVDAIKIDVEGRELDVLAGAERILAENPHLTLCVEWNPMWLREGGHDPMELLDAISERGFRPTLVADESRRVVVPVDEVWPSVAAGGADDHWWANVIAYGADAAG